MPEMNPLVSIVMPVYNAEDFLGEAIESVFGQTYSNWELIAIDDGSTDNSLNILRDFHLKDKRVRVLVNESNRGVAETLNRGIRAAKGIYIARMDADDLMKPLRLERQIHFMKKHPSYVAVGTWMEVIDPISRVKRLRKLPSKHQQIYDMMYYAMGLQHPSVMFNRTLIPSNFDWYRRVKYAEDLDMFLRLVHYGKLANIPQYLYQYRVMKTNESLKNIKATFNAALKVRKRAVLQYGYTPTLEGKIKQSLSKMLMLLPQPLIMKVYDIWRS